ncbi:lysozyme [Flavobacterium sp. HNIBRBA15423]|uniref:lysozyme n=1 Tax=Flavobacterium sp. HNIBRBA15423 TaxID=3458683 RepID=UPI004044ACF6
MSLKLSQNGLDHIKSWESFRATAYDDLQPSVKITSASQVRGTLTIGYGHTKTAKVGQTITRERANELLLKDVANAVDSIYKYVKVPLTQNQFDSLVSFVYNIGEPQFSKSTLLKYLNAQSYHNVSAEFDRWVYSKGKKLEGLVNRRNSEKSLFLNGLGVMTYTTLGAAKSAMSLWFLIPIVIFIFW